MSTPLIIREDLGNGIIRLTLNDPNTRNAMTETMAQLFVSQISELRLNENMRVLILTGSGKAFSGGGHLDMLEAKTKLSQLQNRKLMELFYAQFLSIVEIDVPVIAAINGHAVGAGLCLALSCDIRVASKEAKLGLNFVNLGLHPGMGVTYFLPRLVGPAKAAELLYCGKIISAEEGKELGIVNQAVEDKKFQEKVMEIATAISEAGPQAVKELKDSLRMSMKLSLSECLQREAECQARDYESEQFKEGIRAAKEKRKPKFI